MHKNFAAGMGAGVLFALLAVASPAHAQTPQPTKPTSPPTTQPVPTVAQQAPIPAVCTAAVRDSVPVRTTPVAIDAAITQAIGDSVKAEFPAESKIVVSSAAASPLTPQVVKLTLDTSAAAPGEWSLVLKGTSGDCTGKVQVIPGTKQ